MGKQPFAVDRSRRVGLDIKLPVKQAEQRAETLLDAAVRCRRDEDEVAVGVIGESPYELVALVLHPIRTTRPRAHMGFERIQGEFRSAEFGKFRSLNIRS